MLGKIENPLFRPPPDPQTKARLDRAIIERVAMPGRFGDPAPEHLTFQQICEDLQRDPPDGVAAEDITPELVALILEGQCQRRQWKRVHSPEETRKP